MKKFFPALVIALAVVFHSSAIAQTAPKAPKVGVIDLKKVFDNYWKTKQADANLKSQAGELDKKRKQMMDDYDKSKEEYNKLLESTKDQAVSESEREKRKKDAEAKLMVIREIETSMQQFDRTARTTLGEKQRQMRENILREIKEAISAKAKSGGYDMIMDVAAESVNGTLVIPYWNGQGDISDDVLSHINANAPADIPAAAPAEKSKSK